LEVSDLIDLKSERIVAPRPPTLTSIPSLLSRERDEARDALSKVTIGTGSGGGGDAMQIDNEGLSDELAAKVDAAHEKYDMALFLS
jgi:pre-mRNA-processing factor 19